jgi:hypothetical protein
MSRTAWKALAAILALAGIAAYVWFLFLWLRPIYEHRKWSERVKANLYALCWKRPPEVPSGQWEFMVGWTIMLQNGCGSHHTVVDQDQKGPFLDELERRLQEPVTVATIDWIWDEYARITPGGREFGERYRPTRSPDLESAQPGCFALYVP